MPALDLRKVVDTYLRESFRRQSPPRVSELAWQLGITRVTLTKNFRAITGIPLGAHLRQAQIDCAKRLLRSTNWSSSTIAHHAAFSSDRAFLRAFLQQTGMTPTQFRASDNPTTR